MEDLQNCSVDPVDQHGMQHIRGPLLVGGVDILSLPTGLPCDHLVRLHLDSEERFQAYMEFRDEAIKIAASQLVSKYNSPVDLFGFIGIDEKIFQTRHLHDNKTSRERNQHDIIADIQSDGSGAHSIWSMVSFHAPGLRRALTYFAYRKWLLKLDFIQWNSDPEEGLKRLKCSNKWSELEDQKLKLGLQRHMYLAKEYKMSQMDSTSRNSSISESFEKVALEKINWELASELEKYLFYSDRGLVGHYFNRTNLTHVARECATQAQNTGIVLVEKALPIREGNLSMSSASPSASKLAVMRQKVTQSLEGCMGSLLLFGRSAGRGKACFVAFTAVGVVESVGTGREKLKSTFGT